VEQSAVIKQSQKLRPSDVTSLIVVVLATTID